MNICEALEIFEIDDISNLNIDRLKKKYHKFALKYHPDKNDNTATANAKFQKINEAYATLKNEIMGDDEHFNAENMYCDYSHILNLFIHEVLNAKYCVKISDIVKIVINGCKNIITAQLFENLDKDTLVDLYSFLSKHKNILHVSQNTLDIIKDLVIEKCSGDQVYILNPSVDDLFEDNIYKLCINDEIYFVPLWHNELYFDSNKNDVIVKCIPELPKNVYIDDDNNVNVALDVIFSYSLIADKYITFYVGRRKFTIDVCDLKFKTKQTVIMKGTGISKINLMDTEFKYIYDTENKSDVYVKINFIDIS